MPRYVVERTYPDRFEIPQTVRGRQSVETVVMNNAGEMVTWIHSYVTTAKDKSFCVYDGPNPEAIRSAAASNGLPVDSITEVHVLDPYFYIGTE